MQSVEEGRREERGNESGEEQRREERGEDRRGEGE